MHHKDNDPWIVYGRIVGEYLPTVPIQVDNFTIGPAPTNLVIPDRSERPSFGPIEWPNSVSECANTKVRSNCYFWISRSADSQTEAIDLVEREDLPRLQSVLSAHAGRHPYHVEIICVLQGSLYQPAPSSMASCTLFEPKEPPAAFFAEVGADMVLLAGNSKASTIFRHFSNAIRQIDTANTALEEEAALLSAFKVIEGFANLIPVPIVPETLKLEQDGVVGALLLELQKVSATESKVLSIRSARDKLERLEVKFLDLRISNVARYFCLSPDWEKHAKDFATFRNRRLGHSAPRTTTAERKPWLNRLSDTSALALVRVVTKAFLDRERK